MEQALADANAHRLASTSLSQRRSSALDATNRRRGAGGRKRSRTAGCPTHARAADPPGLPKSLADDFRHGFAKVDGVRLHYVFGGKGPPLLLIPGWPQSWYAWRKVMPPLAKRFTVLAVDPKGLGDSDKPLGGVEGTGYDAGTVADELAALMSTLGHEQFAVVGHDVGMWIGVALAARHPERVTRLAVMEAVLPGVGKPPPLLLPTQANDRLWHFPFNRSPMAEALVRGRERAFLAWQFENKSAVAGAITDADLDEYARTQAAPGGMAGGFAYYRAIPRTMTTRPRIARTRQRRIEAEYGPSWTFR